MLQQNLKYDPVRDVSSVQPYGFIDLRKALETKRIPADASAVPAAFNGIEEPAAVLGRPADAFDSLAMQETIRNYKPANALANAPAND